VDGSGAGSRADDSLTRLGRGRDDVRDLGVIFRRTVGGENKKPPAIGHRPYSNPKNERTRSVLGTGAGRAALTFDCDRLIKRVSHQGPAQFDLTGIMVGSAENDRTLVDNR
jgi:hypothetical protein